MGFDNLELGVGRVDSLELGVGIQRWGSTALNCMPTCRGGISLPMKAMYTHKATGSYFSCVPREEVFTSFVQSWFQDTDTQTLNACAL